MSDNQVIPEAAVEAAARVLAGFEGDDWVFEPPKMDGFTRGGTDASVYLRHAALALEAAAPHMVAAVKAEAWDECVAHAAEMGCLHEFDAPDMHSSNPYRATK